MVQQLENQNSLIGDPESWSTGRPFIEFLNKNDLSSRFAILIITRHQFVHAIIVHNSKLVDIDPDDLIKWSLSIPEAAAGYCYSYRNPDSVHISRDIEGTLTKTLENSKPLLFGRYFPGLTNPNKRYYEMNQEIIHLSELHWMHEKQAYCKIDRLGDILEVINITQTEASGNKQSIITCEPHFLEDYLFTTDSSLVRLFEFQISKRNGDLTDRKMADVVITETPGIFYKRYVVETGLFLRGLQIIRPHNTRDFVLNRIMRVKQVENKYVEFMALDLRDGQIKKISTNPEATCNYFNLQESDKPLELSPAFFRQEVLSKYKQDPDKYDLTDRFLNCRDAWTLRGLDFNNSGQIHTYICDLAAIPYEEQLYWLSYNEDPKDGLSERAIRNDFFAQWYSNDRPIDQIKATLRRWETERVEWWTLSISTKYAGFDYPLSENKQEWAKHFLELAKLIIEGLSLKYLKRILNQEGFNYSKEEANQSITLLEKVLTAVSGSTEPVHLPNLREVQRLRTKLSAHISGKEAMEITQNALGEFGTYESHFQNICVNVHLELLEIENTLKEFRISE